MAIISRNITFQTIKPSTDWRPAPGFMKTISANTPFQGRRIMLGSNYRGGDYENKWDQSSSTWVEHLGPNGGYVVTNGGGHGGAHDSGCDMILAGPDCLWNQVTHPYPDPGLRGSIPGTNSWYLENPDAYDYFNCEYRVNGVDGSFYGGQISTHHNKNINVATPGGTRGYGVIYHPITSSFDSSGNISIVPYTHTMHMFDCGLEVPTVDEPASFDITKKFWKRGGTVIKENSSVSQPIGTIYIGADFGWYDPDNDHVLHIGVGISSFQSRIWSYNRATNSYFHAATITGTVPYLHSECGGCYIPERRLLLLLSSKLPLWSSTNPGANVQGDYILYAIDLSPLKNVNSGPVNVQCVELKTENAPLTITKPTTVTDIADPVVRAQFPIRQADYPLAALSLTSCPEDGYLYGLRMHYWLTTAELFRVKGPTRTATDTTRYDLRDTTVTNAQLMAASTGAWRFDNIMPLMQGDKIIGSSMTLPGRPGLLNHMGYNAMKWSPKNRCLVWHQGAHHPFQMINPRGVGL